MRILQLLALLGLCALLASGCADSKEDRAAKSPPRQDSAKPADHAAKDRPPDAIAGYDPRAMLNKMKEMGKAPSDAGGGVPESPVEASSPAPRPREAMAEEAMAGGKHETPIQPPEKPQILPQSGLLTAGSFDDNLTPQFYQRFVRNMTQNRHLGNLPPRFAGQRLLVTVRNGDGKPVGNCRVHVAPAAGGPGVDLISRSNGSAVCLTSWDGIDTVGDLVVTVTPPDGSPALKEVRTALTS